MVLPIPTCFFLCSRHCEQGDLGWDVVQLSTAPKKKKKKRTSVLPSIVCDGAVPLSDEEKQTR